MAGVHKTSWWSVGWWPVDRNFGGGLVHRGWWTKIGGLVDVGRWIIIFVVDGRLGTGGRP